MQIENQEQEQLISEKSLSISNHSNQGPTKEEPRSPL